MKAKRKAAVSEVVSNAERLLADAELLIEHGRFASAYMLAVLAFEEVGKAVLWTWGESEAAPKAAPMSLHLRKQKAVGCLLLAQFTSGVIGQHLAKTEGTPEKRIESLSAHANVEALAKAMYESTEGRLTQLIEIGAVDKAKQASVYVDHWFVEHDIGPAGFKDSDALRFVTDTRRALILMTAQLPMRVGLAIFRAGTDRRSLDRTCREPRPDQHH